MSDDPFCKPDVNGEIACPLCRAYAEVKAVRESEAAVLEAARRLRHARGSVRYDLRLALEARVDEWESLQAAKGEPQ